MVTDIHEYYIPGVRSIIKMTLSQYLEFQILHDWFTEILYFLRPIFLEFHFWKYCFYFWKRKLSVLEMYFLLISKNKSNISKMKLQKNKNWFIFYGPAGDFFPGNFTGKKYAILFLKLKPFQRYYCHHKLCHSHQDSSQALGSYLEELLSTNILRVCYY